MSRIRADRYTNRLGTGAPLFANGVNVTGNVGVGTTVPTSKLSVIGDMNVTGTVSVGGTLSYEDVTDIDSVGIITAQSGIQVTGGSVGIGTAIPGALLSIESTAANAAKIRLGFDSPRYYDIFRGSTTNSGYLNFYGSQSSYVGYTFGGVDGEWMRIDSSGRIGIGAANNTSYDTNAQNVLIASDGNTGITIRSAGSSPYAMIHFADGTTNNSEKRAGRILYQHDGNNMSFYTNDTQHLRITGSGDMGLGTVSPTSDGGTTFEIYNASTPTLKLNDGGEYKALFQLRGNDLEVRGSNGAMEFYTGNADGASSTERLRITSDGKFGFKTTTPNYTVDINGEVGITEGQPITWHNGSGSLSAQIFAQSDDSLVFRNTSVGAERMRLDSSGRLMLGTTTEGYAGAQTLTIAEGGNSGITIRSGTAQNGSIAFSDATSGTGEYDGFVQYRHATQDLVLATNATERLRLTSTGAMLVPGVYSGTTATGANVVVEPDGTIRRSTSSIKYKNNVTTLSDDLADKILECRAVSYTSKCEGDDNAKINYGLIAEEVYDVDPSLVFTDNGEPEGVQYDRFVPHLVNLVKRQKTQIETLEQRLTDAGL